MNNRYLFYSTSLASLLLLVLTGCLKDECTSTQIYYQYTPVYMTETELREGLSVAEPRPLENPGKIYVYGQYLLINELDEGVHIIDNRDPRNPVPVSFVTIPGNVDMAVFGDMLYADSYVDLVTIDISDPASPTLASRQTFVFPGLGRDPQRGIVVRYEKTEVTQEMPCGENRLWFGTIEGDFFIRPQVLSSNSRGADGAFSSAQAAAIGIGGSLARFTIAKNHLYTIDEWQMHIFDLSDRAQPRMVGDLPVGWQIETIFPNGENLFIGSRSGMFIFDNSNPTSPTQLSFFEHARACDPVYVDGETAYITLRDGTECDNFNNQLDVVNITDLTRPRLLRSYPMHHPIGLSVLDNHLYLCEDDQGLKVFDVSDPDRISDRLVSHRTGFTTYDVITLAEAGIAIVVGRDGLYQFDIADPAELKELSVIPVNRK